MQNVQPNIAQLNEAKQRYVIENHIYVSRNSINVCRKDEVVLCRARIGHTYMTHSYILKKDPPPQCEHCQCILTVRHILVECNYLAQTRNDIFGRCGVAESFQFQPELVLNFL